MRTGIGCYGEEANFCHGLTGSIARREEGRSGCGKRRGPTYTHAEYRRRLFLSDLASLLSLTDDTMSASLGMEYLERYLKIPRSLQRVATDLASRACQSAY